MGYGIPKTSTRKWIIPIQLTTPNNLNPQLVKNLKLAVEHWNKETKLALFVLAGVKTSIVQVKSDGVGAGGSYTSGDKGLGKPLTDVTPTLALGNTITLHNIIHELGHVLGLAHEEERPGDKGGEFTTAKRAAAPDVQGWLLDMQWQGCRKREKTFGYIAHGGFDSDSVMKYGNSNGQLSKGDIETIKGIYG